MSVAFYISGHGFGHASRQIEIINSLSAGFPASRPATSTHSRSVPVAPQNILIRTSAPRWLFDRTVSAPFMWFDAECDTGVVQVDSLRLDIGETVRRAREFYDRFEPRVAEEAAFLQEQRVRLVVSDAPPLACAAASRVGIRSVVVSNFTWDWIYEGYREQFEADAPGVLPAIRAAYRETQDAWRLPMYGGFETFSRITDLPFVARHGRGDLDRADVLSALSLPADRPLALCSFGGYGLDGLDLFSLDCLRAWTVVITGRDAPADLPTGVVFVDEASIYVNSLRYEDLVGACDVVVTKPGYGIIAECVANGTALLYTSRGHFPEYEVLVREMPRYLRCAFIEQDALLAGRWLKALDDLLELPPAPERPVTNGAEIAAGLIAAALD